jgi:hypothetical protein
MRTWLALLVAPLVALADQSVNLALAGWAVCRKARKGRAPFARRHVAAHARGNGARLEGLERAAASE